MDRCNLCHWREACDERLTADDHLSAVANITKVQIRKCQDAGIPTLEALAGLPADTRIAKLNPDTLSRLGHQASLQLEKRQTGKDRCDPLEVAPGRGFTRLPRPDPGDLFFDMEGDPYEPGGLEYLFGVGDVEEGTFHFRDFWAHDRSSERTAFEAFIEFAMGHLKTHPAAHIYHYAPYEVTAMKRLMSLHGTREADVDHLLRTGKFVDLYKVVREGIRVSEPRYSIKNMETFYGEKRSGDVKNAGASIVWYERWKETGEDQLLKDIRSYNEDDCRSTWQLREWLLGLRPKGLSWFGQGLAGPEDAEVGPNLWEQELESYRQSLLGHLPDDSVSWDAEGRMRETAFQLLDFHRREDKPKWWAMFARMEATEEELLEDLECLAGLTLDPDKPPQPDKRSMIYTYLYPEQETKLKTGDQVSNTADGKALNDIEIDEVSQRAILRVGNTYPLSGEISVGPGKPLDTKVMKAALRRFANSLIAGNSRYGALRTVLLRNQPTLRGRSGGSPLLSGKEDLLIETIQAVDALEDSYLFIQGPPGAGKTWTGSRLIVEMLQRGKRVGVASNSHKAIHNLLSAVEAFADEVSFVFQGAKKGTSGNPSTLFNGHLIRNVDNPESIRPGDRLVAGTAWLFSRPEFDQGFDYLFVDEAGQVALANLIAMGTCAKNLVLLGDPMQLGQPTQGTHPGHSGESGLEYLLDGRATVPPEQGVFLPTSWRMAPTLCRFISEAVYDGRLEPEASNHFQRLVLNATADPILAEEGIRFLAVTHDGNGQRSTEEADRIRTLFLSLLQQKFIDRSGHERPMGLEDILVVAPYNMQVNLLRETLPAGARVGTVDKFQGQEAPVVIVSMATSNEDYMPRDIGFLFSKNRLNVAISRAQCLAVVVASPRLLTVKCNTVEQMALVNLMCWVADAGT